MGLTAGFDGGALRRMRRAAGLSQRRLAVLVRDLTESRTTEETVRRHEADASANPEWRTVEGYCDVLGVSADVFRTRRRRP